MTSTNKRPREDDSSPQVAGSKNNEDDISWRNKCIEEFNLKPVPHQWEDDVAKGGPARWKTYYEYRKKKEEIFAAQAAGADDDQDGLHYVLAEWKKRLQAKVVEIMGSKEAAKWKWPVTLTAKDLCWEDEEELRTATFLGHVWSPYAIPRAIRLKQFYHFRPRYSSVEFSVTWAYQLVDFEGRSQDWDELCSNCYQDEELRADVIKTKNLSRGTIDHIRAFLYGTNSKALDEEICHSFDFAVLLFASMGTINDRCVCGSDIGYSWTADFFHKPKLYDALMKAKVIKNEEDKYDLPSISWLEYSLRRATGKLRPIDSFYTPPTIRDAIGYQSPEEEDSENDWENDM